MAASQLLSEAVRNRGTLKGWVDSELLPRTGRPKADEGGTVLAWTKVPARTNIKAVPVKALNWASAGRLNVWLSSLGSVTTIAGFMSGSNRVLGEWGPPCVQAATLPIAVLLLVLRERFIGALLLSALAASLVAPLVPSLAATILPFSAMYLICLGASFRAFAEKEFVYCRTWFGKALVVAFVAFQCLAIHNWFVLLSALPPAGR